MKDVSEANLFLCVLERGGGAQELYTALKYERFTPLEDKPQRRRLTARTYF